MTCGTNKAFPQVVLSFYDKITLIRECEKTKKRDMSTEDGTREKTEPPSCCSQVYLLSVPAPVFFFGVCEGFFAMN